MGRHFPHRTRIDWARHWPKMTLLLSLAVHLCLIAAGLICIRQSDGPVPEVSQSQPVMTLTLIKPPAEPQKFAQLPPDAPNAPRPLNAQQYAAKNSAAANPELNKNSPTPNHNPRKDAAQTTFQAGLTRLPKVAANPLHATKAIAPAPTAALRQPTAPPRSLPEKPVAKSLVAKTAPALPSTAGTIPQSLPPAVHVAQVEAVDLSALPSLPTSEPSTQPSVNPILARAKSRLEASGNAAGPATLVSANGQGAARGPFRLETEGFIRGEYDDRMLSAIYLAWIGMLREHRFYDPFVVVVDFDQTAEGAIRNLRAITSDFTPVASAVPVTLPRHICSESILQPQPFGKWPEAMRREIGAEQRRCRISFHLIILPN